MVALGGLCRQTGFDVTQTLPKGKLSKRHGAIWLSACERPRAVVATVALHQAREGAPRQRVHKLSEQRLANVHGAPPGKVRRACSNRRHCENAQKPLQTQGLR